MLARKYHSDIWNEEISKISKKETEERFKSISNAFEDLELANYLALLLKKTFFTKRYKKEIVFAFVFLFSIELPRPLVV